MTTSNLPTVYVVERIVFDWSTDDGIDVSDADKERALCAAVGRWIARDEDHLLSQISDATGWCIKDISYFVVPDGPRATKTTFYWRDLCACCRQMIEFDDEVYIDNLAYHTSCAPNEYD